MNLLRPIYGPIYCISSTFRANPVVLFSPEFWHFRAGWLAAEAKRAKGAETPYYGGGPGTVLLEI